MHRTVRQHSRPCLFALSQAQSLREAHLSIKLPRSPPAQCVSDFVSSHNVVRVLRLDPRNYSEMQGCATLYRKGSQMQKKPRWDRQVPGQYSSLKDLFASHTQRANDVHRPKPCPIGHVGGHMVLRLLFWLRTSDITSAACQYALHFPQFYQFATGPALGQWPDRLARPRQASYAEECCLRQPQLADRSARPCLPLVCIAN